MHKITVFPLNILVGIDEETSLLHALQDAGVYIKSKCGGHANCGCCVVKIQMGEDNLAPPTYAELKLLGNVFHITKERLACQTKVLGNITIDVSAHDAAKDENDYKRKTNKPKPKTKTKVRKKDDVEELRELRAKEEEKLKEELKEKTETWFKHWEKSDLQQEGYKKLGGNKKPKFFDTSKLEVESDDKKTEK